MSNAEIEKVLSGEFTPQLDEVLHTTKTTETSSSCLSTSEISGQKSVDNGSELDRDDDKYDEHIDKDSKNISVSDVSDDELVCPIPSMESYMDAVIDQVTGSPSLDSKEKSDKLEASGPAPGSVRDYESAYDAFISIWSDEILAAIVDETNRYAAQTIDNQSQKSTLNENSRLHQWTDTNANEILVLFAINILIGFVIRRVKECWSESDWDETLNFRKLLPYNRYILLMKFLNLIDDSIISENTQEKVADPGKLQTLIDHLNERFLNLRNLHPEDCILFYVSKGDRKLVAKPTSGKVFNQPMGENDLKNFSLWIEHEEDVKLNTLLIRRLLYVSINNAYVVFMNSQKRRKLGSMTHRQFRRKLADEIIERHCMLQGDPELEMRLRRDIVHMPVMPLAE